MLGPCVGSISKSGRRLHEQLKSGNVEYWKSSREGKHRLQDSANADAEKLQQRRVENMAWRRMGMGEEGAVDMSPTKPASTLPPLTSSANLLTLPADGEPGSEVSRAKLDAIIEKEPMSEWAATMDAAKTGDMEEIRRENMAWRMMHASSQEASK